MSSLRNLPLQLVLIEESAAGQNLPKPPPQGSNQRWQRRLAGALLLLFYGLPWLDWNGRQAVLLDLPARRFDFFGLTLLPGDFGWLVWAAAVAIAGLCLLTASAGRLWCGFGCPQTIMSGIYRAIERRTAPGTPPQLVALHIIWAAIAIWTGVTFVGFFSPIRALLAHTWPLSWSSWEIFWAGFYALATWGNAGFLRDQVCTYLCPYARMERLLCDQQTPRVAYDPRRGEPRGPHQPGLRSVLERTRGLLDSTTARDYAFRATHAELAGPMPRFSPEHLGDCVDCRQCVQACPQGLDIRAGHDARCTDCGACIDACNTRMARLQFPTGLIRRVGSSDVARMRGMRPRIAIPTTALVLLLLGGALALLL